MPIARFVTAKDIQRIHNERNPDNPIGYGMACTIKQTCREKYEKEFGKLSYTTNVGYLSRGMRHITVRMCLILGRNASRKGLLYEKKSIKKDAP